MLTFKEFIQESPELSFGNTEDFIEKQVNRIRQDIIKHHNNSDKIGETEQGTYHKLIIPDDKSRINYYHMVSGQPKEVSVVKANTQYVVSKGNGGNSIHNKWFMKHHAKTNGELKTYETHTDGSKKLWSDLVKENDPEFSLFHSTGNTENKMDNDYLTKNEHNIWNKGNNFRKHRIILRPNV